MIVNKKSPKCSTWLQSQKCQNDLCSFPMQDTQFQSNPRLKIARRNINNLRYADDTTLMAESEEELKDS